MNIFEENYEPIQITLKNKEGKEFVLNSQLRTSGDIKKASDIIKDKTKDNITQLYEMMSIMFPKPLEFWSQFSPDLLSRVAEYINEEENKKKQ